MFGEVGKIEHKKKVSEYRDLTHMRQTGSAAGNNGPTLFCMKGKKRRTGYDEGFLLRNGAAPGSTIVMTETALMTEKA